MGIPGTDDGIRNYASNILAYFSLAWINSKGEMGPFTEILVELIPYQAGKSGDSRLLRVV